MIIALGWAAEKTSRITRGLVCSLFRLTLCHLEGLIHLPAARVCSASFQTLIYGHVVSALAHAPISTEEAGRYGFVKPAPIALLPEDSAKLIPTGGVVSVPTELVPTLTHIGLVLSMFGGAL